MTKQYSDWPCQPIVERSGFNYRLVIFPSCSMLRPTALLSVDLSSGTRQNMAEALAFAADGKVNADVKLQPLENTNNIFKRLDLGDVAARVVIDYLTRPLLQDIREREEVYAH